MLVHVFHISVALACQSQHLIRGHVLDQLLYFLIIERITLPNTLTESNELLFGQFNGAKLFPTWLIMIECFSLAQFGEVILEVEARRDTDALDYLLSPLWNQIDLDLSLLAAHDSEHIREASKVMMH